MRRQCRMSNYFQTLASQYSCLQPENNSSVSALAIILYPYCVQSVQHWMSIVYKVFNIGCLYKAPIINSLFFVFISIHVFS